MSAVDTSAEAVERLARPPRKPPGQEWTAETGNRTGALTPGRHQRSRLVRT